MTAQSPKIYFGTNIGGTIGGIVAATSHDINLVSAPKAGNLLLYLVRVAVAGAITYPAGWTKLFDASPDADDDQMALAWKQADGTETSVITVSHASGKCAGVFLELTGCANPNKKPPELSVVAIGASTAPNPSSLTPTSGKQNYLWISMLGYGGIATITGRPFAGGTSGFMDGNSGSASTAATNCVTAVNWEWIQGTVQDPGAWGISGNSSWTAYTVAITPCNQMMVGVNQAVKRAASF